MNKQTLLNTNEHLYKEIKQLHKKYTVCLQAIDALSNYDHTGIVQKTLEELDKIDGGTDE
tara:strand:- start:86 stop:265 length:180 start_codon:yes stop_codon:yes gene_type:complete